MQSTGIGRAARDEPTRRRTASGTSLARSRRSPSLREPQQQQAGDEDHQRIANSNMRVYVRCRSRNEREIGEKSSVVISTLGAKGREVILSNAAGSLTHSKRTYTFDQVFGAESDQETVFDEVAKDYIREMLEGYNCTVFAYGQTGTGKTYTMSGDISILGDLDSQDKILLGEHSGIIPRVLVDLFKQLSQETQEYTVKVSFLELYNERLKDLLAENEQVEENIRIFDNNSGLNVNKHLKQLAKADGSTGSSTRTSSASSSSSSIIVKGMEEVYIRSAHEGLELLMAGSLKRKVAATKCNDLSSRSHTVFTITTNVARTDPVSSEQYIKMGKLNLVDLAGSENINRSGAENKRAQEAGLINKSLLTLGRVINALVDNSQHIPYRESKLTRLLQDSLGGKTKTCIIATISPAKISMDETVSTLEYATRAKSIKNTPQVNQSMSKNSCLGEYIREMERLRQELKASRQKDGMYITEDQFQLYESNSILVEEQKVRIRNMEEQITKFKEKYVEQTNLSKEAENKLKQSHLLCRKISQEKAEISEKFQYFRQTCNEYVGKVNDVHESNLVLIRSLKNERDSLFGKSIESIDLISSLIADISKKGDKLSELNMSLQAYNSKYNQVSAGVFEDMESRVQSHQKTCVDQLSSIRLDDFITDIQSMHNSLIRVLSDLQNIQFDEKNSIYLTHKRILSKCQAQVCRHLRKLETSSSELMKSFRETLTSNINSFSNLGEGHSVGVIEMVEVQEQLIKDLENKLRVKSRALEKSNVHLLGLKEYFKNNVIKQRSKTFEELRKALEVAETQQVRQDEELLKTSVDTLQSVKSQICDEHVADLRKMAELGASSLNLLTKSVKSFKGKLLQLSEGSTERLGELLTRASITTELHEFSTIVSAMCSDVNSEDLVTAINELKGNIVHEVKAAVDASTGICAQSSEKTSATSSQIKQRLENAISELDTLCQYLLADYKDNVNQITKTQNRIITGHCTDAGTSIKAMKNLAQLLEVPSHPTIMDVSNLIDSELPKLTSPDLLPLEDLRDDGENENPGSPRRNLLIFNPSTPVPVPDQPLPKVLLPRSINSTAKRSTMSCFDGRKPQPTYSKNLKRRLTTDPVIRSDEVQEKRPRSGGLMAVSVPGSPEHLHLDC